jgi:hypothetical protein
VTAAKEAFRTVLVLNAKDIDLLLLAMHALAQNADSVAGQCQEIAAKDGRPIEYADLRHLQTMIGNLCHRLCCTQDYALSMDSDCLHASGLAALLKIEPVRL